MPNIGHFHPQIVHFAIVLLFFGVGARWLAFWKRLPWMAPAATTLLLSGTAAAALAVWSGDRAHGPAERVPGARDAVVEHEEWGKRTRNIFFAVAALELAALALGRRPRARHWALVASGVIGLGGSFALFETGEHGGDLVYGYAGGVGVRNGDSAVARLLVAGLYHQAQVDRAADRPAEAARLIQELSLRMPSDTNVKFLAVESLIRDHQDGKGAFAALAELPDTGRFAVRHGLLRVDAYQLAGNADSAQAVLQRLAQQFPNSRAVQQRLNRP